MYIHTDGRGTVVENVIEGNSATGRGPRRRGRRAPQHHPAQRRLRHLGAQGRPRHLRRERAGRQPAGRLAHRARQRPGRERRPRHP
ncbi:MAG: hypothetical protein R3F43_22400 [bacterium]